MNYILAVQLGLGQNLGTTFSRYLRGWLIGTRQISQSLWFGENRIIILTIATFDE